MLAIPPHRSTSICTRCALRLRLFAFQQRRLQSSAQPATEPGFEFLVRFPTSRASNEAKARSNKPRRTVDAGVRHLDLKGGLSPRPFDKWSLLAKNRDHDFRDALSKRLESVKHEVKTAPLLEQVTSEVRQQGANERLSFERLWNEFAQRVLRTGEQKQPFGNKVEDNNSLRNDLLSSWKLRGQHGLDDRLKYLFYGHIVTSRFSQSELKNQEMLADLRYPAEWFPGTRIMQRTIHLHVGPTNSGKTFQALQRLEQATNGIYAGPLRLLAHEVYSRMNARGKPCSLITGEERRLPEAADPSSYMAACTVEMLPLNKILDVAVIDEIQMIGNAERGWAWTQALLGVRAKEVHLCGEERTVPLIREICASLGEKLEIHHYKRLSPLKMADKALDGDLKKLRKGDCIVSFSVMGIHALRKQIEQMTGRKVATVYGSLPPETRAQQARLFNDPNNEYDFLVASDAVGMGLNLAIKRVIFEASSKYDGMQQRALSIADIKQIGGRAGRFRVATQAAEAPLSKQDLAAAKGDPGTAKLENPAKRDDEIAENVGLVTTLERFDYPIVRAAMESDPEPITTAGIFPPAPVLERFASYFPPRTPFSYILTRLHELSQMHRRFHLCGLKDQVWVADMIEPVEGLTISDRNTICAAPAGKSDVELWKTLLPAYAKCIAEQTGGNLADIQELPLEIMEAEAAPSREYLRDLERLHKGIVTYLWLSYRFAGIFNTRALALHVKGLVEEKIEHVLGQFSFSEIQRRKLAARREKDILKSLLAAAANDQEDDMVQGGHNIASVPKQSSDAIKDNIEEAMAKLAEPAEDPYATESHKDSVIGEDVAGISEHVLLHSGRDEQTSLTGGGDHFAGEEDLGLEEPGMVEEQPAQESKRHQTSEASIGNPEARNI